MRSTDAVYGDKVAILLTALCAPRVFRLWFPVAAIVAVILFVVHYVVHPFKGGMVLNTTANLAIENIDTCHNARESARERYFDLCQEGHSITIQIKKFIAGC